MSRILYKPFRDSFNSIVSLIFYSSLINHHQNNPLDVMNIRVLTICMKKKRIAHNMYFLKWTKRFRYRKYTQSNSYTLAIVWLYVPTLWESEATAAITYSTNHEQSLTLLLTIIRKTHLQINSMYPMGVPGVLCRYSQCICAFCCKGSLGCIANEDKFHLNTNHYMHWYPDKIPRHSISPTHLH